MWVRWLARAAAVLAILYLSLFSLDIFSSGAPVGAMLLGFLIHNIPSLILIIILVIAWRFEIAGGILFLLACVAPFLLLSNPFWVNAALAAPFFFTGILFLLSAWVNPKRILDTEETSTTSAQ